MRARTDRLGGERPCSPEGPCTQQSGTWVLGDNNSSTGFGQVYDY